MRPSRSSLPSSSRLLVLRASAFGLIAGAGLFACSAEPAPPAQLASQPPSESGGPDLEPTQSRANGVQVFAPDGAVAFNLVPWENDWALVSPTGQITGRARAFGNDTKITDAAGKDVAASIRPFPNGAEVLDGDGQLLATIRQDQRGHRILAADGTSLLHVGKSGVPTREGEPYKSPLQVRGSAFPHAAHVLSLSAISFAGRVALLFYLSTPV